MSVDDVLKLRVPFATRNLCLQPLRSPWSLRFCFSYREFFRCQRHLEYPREIILFKIGNNFGQELPAKRTIDDAMVERKRKVDH